MAPLRSGGKHTFRSAGLEVTPRGPEMADLTSMSAAAMARAIREKRVSSVELVQARLRRIEKVNPKLNAVVAFASDALDRAKTADKAVAGRWRMGPLHGVPMTIKDALETEGVVSTGGTLGRARYVPATDATAVARMRQAGAILLGKTNLPEASCGFESDNLVYGRANNPYDVRRTPGGSSGGEAAIIAAGGSPIGLGSDAGGSIRVPAHYCGIAGLKPTSGRVPRTGHWPRFSGLLDSWNQVGPMARYVEDLALVLPIISGPDWIDPHIVPIPLGDPKRVKLGNLRVAVFTENGTMTASRETQSAVKKAADALAAIECKVEHKVPAAIHDTHEIIVSIWQADGGAGVRAAVKAAGTTKVHAFIADVFNFTDTRPISAAKLGSLLVRLDEFRSRMLSFMKDYDAIVCPASALPAMRHGATFDRENFPAFTHTQTFNLTGWPSAVVRGGASKEGLPINVQVVAKPWREDVTLAVAAHLEAALGGWIPPDVGDSA